MDKVISRPYYFKYHNVEEKIVINNLLDKLIEKYNIMKIDGEDPNWFRLIGKSNNIDNLNKELESQLPIGFLK